MPSLPAVFSARRDDDADLIRARLRALLDEGRTGRGWLPDDDPGAPTADRGTARAWDDEEDADEWSVAPVRSRRHLAVVPEPCDEDARGTVGLGRVAVPASVGRAVDGPVDEEDDGPEDDGAAGRHRAAGAGVRVTPGRTSARALWIAALVAAAVVGGWSWLGRPTVDPVPADAVAPVTAAPATTAADPSATPVVVVVAVVGQVVNPGLVTLPVGSRVADAVAAAGGLLPEADPAGFNAAALLTDGQQVAIGVPGAVAAPVAPGQVPAAGGLVDLNTATAADLDVLPGIGPVLAQRIVDHRTASGPFASVEQLDDVNGIGPALYADVSPLVTV